MADVDPRVLAAATALARAATAEFIRISEGEGKPWDELPPERQQAAIRAQIGYAQTAITAADHVLRDDVTAAPGCCAVCGAPVRPCPDPDGLPPCPPWHHTSGGHDHDATPGRRQD